VEEAIVDLVAGVGAVADIAMALGNQDAVAHSERFEQGNRGKAMKSGLCFAASGA
jgi:hypothetical protein